MKERILFVDDDPNVLEAYRRRLQSVLHVETAEGGAEGLRMITEKGPFAVVVADLRMPGMDGIEFLARVKEAAPNTVRIMLTGNADVNVAIQAVNEGDIFRFLTKPCLGDVLGNSLVAAIDQYRLVTAEKELLEGTLKGTVELLAEILSWVDPEAFGRTVQLRSHAKALGTALKVDDLWELELAATLSQIGYMAVPHDVLVRAYTRQRLNEEERDALQSVPAVAQELIARIPRLDSVARVVLYQHKLFNGAGFPKDSVAGKDIPLASRILKVALDMIDLEAQGRPKKEALQEMGKREGWYDPRVLHAAMQVFSGAADAAESAALSEFVFSLGDLRPGLMLGEDVTTADGRLLVREGTLITDALLVRIRKFASLVGVREPIRVRIVQE